MGRHEKERGQVTAEYTVGALGAATLGAGVMFGPEALVPGWIAEFIARTLTRAFELNLPDLFRWPW